MEACEDYQMSNVQQKKVRKTADTESAVPGERVFIDMSSVSQHTSLGGAKVWLCSVDDATGITWNHLLKRKSDAPKKVMQLARKLLDRGQQVRFIRCDNAGELRKLQKTIDNTVFGKGISDYL